MDAGRSLLDGQTLRDERKDGAPHLLRVATQETRPLHAGEDAAVQAGQGNPLGPPSGPAEGLQSLLPSPEMDDQRGCPWLKARVEVGGGTSGGVGEAEDPFGRGKCATWRDGNRPIAD